MNRLSHIAELFSQFGGSAPTATIRKYPFPADVLPQAVGEAYDTVLYELGEWLGPPSLAPSNNIINYFEELLAECSDADARVRYLCHLTTHGGLNKEAYPMAFFQAMYPLPRFKKLLEGPYFYPEFVFENYYCSWLAVRLIEAVCAVIGNSRLRKARALLWADWEAIEHRKSLYNVEDEETQQLLKFLFGVLVPFANDTGPQHTRAAAQPPPRSVPRPAAGPRPPAPPPEPLPETLQTLCRKGLKPADVRALLAELGAVDSQTGRWHLGELAGKAARSKSAFPAVYRALSDMGLLQHVDGPAWLRIFVAEFEVNLSPRMANYDTTGQVSKAFHEFHGEAVRWGKRWQAKREAEE